MRVLLTGASGFLGRRLVPRLAHAGHSPILLARPSANLPKNIQTIVVESFDPEAVRRALADCRFDAIVNLAAYGVVPTDRLAPEMYLVNTVLPTVLLATGAECGASVFVQAGSSAEYADSNGALLTTASPLERARLYGASKAAATLFVTHCCNHYGISGVSLRLFNVFGPGEASHRLLPSLVSKLTAGEPVRMSAGNQVRDFIHVDDAVTALMRALERGSQISGSVVNVCTGRGTSVRAFAETVARCLDVSPALLEFGALPMRPDEAMSTVGHPADMEDLLQFTPEGDLRRRIAESVEEMVGRSANV